MDVVKEVLSRTFEGFMPFFSKIGKEFNKNKAIYSKIIFIVVPIVIVIVIIHFVITGIRNSECKQVRENVGNYVDTYMMSENIYPTINGDSVSVDISILPPVMFKDNKVSGSVKITKVNDEFIKTYYLENSGYCDTGEFGGERDNYNKDAYNVEVVPYYNYYSVTNNNSKWSDYIPFEEVSTEAVDGVLLPLDEDELPEISEEAIITEIVKEDKVFYSYRDKMWKWYKVKNNNYSGFSSERPSGYTNRDNKTEVKSEYTNWSTSYPDVKDYRVISTSTGYRWYKLVDGEKVYFNSGAYYPESPGEEYERENESNIMMYRYYDKMWKWYNGVSREYTSSMSSKAPNNSYLYKDNDLTSYTKWSNYKDVSSVTSENKSYREEVTNIHSRYMIKYKIRSFLVLDEYLEREAFEEKVGRTVEDMSNDITIEVDVKFKYRY